MKADLASQKSEIEISDYFKKGLNKAVARLTFKHDRLADIQKAIGKADINNDNRLDFNEWRAELKKNGHSDAEIRAMFAGNRNHLCSIVQRTFSNQSIFEKKNDAKLSATGKF